MSLFNYLFYNTQDGINDQQNINFLLIFFSVPAPYSSTIKLSLGFVLASDGYHSQF